MADEEKKDEADSSRSATESETKRAVPVRTNGGGRAAAVAASSHGSHGAHAAHADHGLAHTTPVWLLLTILGALLVLTVLTVSVTSFDLGAQGNLVVAMIIATVKAALVVAFFMHLVWDKKLHLILFLTSVLFLVLFLSLSVNDRGEYEPDIEAFQNSATK